MKSSNDFDKDKKLVDIDSVDDKVGLSNIDENGKIVFDISNNVGMIFGGLLIVVVVVGFGWWFFLFGCCCKDDDEDDEN